MRLCVLLSCALSAALGMSPLAHTLDDCSYIILTRSFPCIPNRTAKPPSPSLYRTIIPVYRTRPPPYGPYTAVPPAPTFTPKTTTPTTTTNTPDVVTFRSTRRGNMATTFRTTTFAPLITLGPGTGTPWPTIPGNTPSTSQAPTTTELALGNAPYFVTLLTQDARQEFYRIAKSPFLTKSEMRYEIGKWATRQPKQVREAIIDIEQELVRQQLEMKKEVAGILEALPVAFVQYASIRDNSALTKHEEREDLEALFDALPLKTATVLRFVLSIAGTDEKAGPNPATLSLDEALTGMIFPFA